MWNMACQSKVSLPSVQKYGWKVNNGNLEFIWDTEENIKKVDERINKLQKGCTCKTGCINKKCTCLRGSSLCGPGCKCLNCNNLPNQSTNTVTSTDLTSDDTDLYELIEEEIQEIDEHFSYKVTTYEDEFSDEE